MAKIEKLSYNDCVSHLGDLEEKVLFRTGQYGKFPLIIISKLNDKTFAIKYKEDDFIFLTPNETGIIFDTNFCKTNLHLANIFMPGDVELSLNDGNDIIFINGDGKKQVAYKYLIVSADGEKIIDFQ